MSLGVARNELPQVEPWLRSIQARTLALGAVWAFTRTAQLVKPDLQAEMRRVFDRPTPFTVRSLFIQAATRSRPQAATFFKDRAERGIAAGRYLRPQILGGQRSLKSFERRLALPDGYIAVPTRRAATDVYGNWSSGQRNAVMAQLSLFRPASLPAQNRRRGVRRHENYFILRPGHGTAAPPGIYMRDPAGRFDSLIVAFVKQRPGGYKPAFDFSGVGLRSARKHAVAAMREGMTRYPPRRGR